jgi:dihydrofolate synthase/folylpolyglutamate synthase
MLPEAERTLRAIARKRQSKVILVRDCAEQMRLVDRTDIGLKGTHQKVNARCAAAAFAVLGENAWYRHRFDRISKREVRHGLSRVVENTGLHGRLEFVGRGKKWLVDVAHNPDGMRTLVQALQQEGEGDLTVVFGVMKDKDYREMLRELRLVTRRIIAVAPAMERALEAEKVVRVATRLGLPAVMGGTVRRGLRMAARAGRVLVTGSHFVVGEALSTLRSENA